MSITLVIGGARSGKSEYAEEIAVKQSDKVAYIATAIPFDDGMKDRIKKHQMRRPDTWYTIEKYKEFSELKTDERFLNSECILLDCLTVLSTNWMFDSDIDFDKVDYEKVDLLDERLKKGLAQLINLCRQENKKLIMVTNEIGLGVIPANKMASIFRDIAGNVNKFVASEADDVYYVVAGIPMKIKDKGVNTRC